MNIDHSAKRRCSSADEALLRSILAENSIKKPCLQHGRECSCSRCSNIPDVRTSHCTDLSADNGLRAKALGMVYSPVQHWQKVYDLDAGLNKGTIFSELDLPFEASSKGGKCGG